MAVADTFGAVSHILMVAVRIPAIPDPGREGDEALGPRWGEGSVPSAPCRARRSVLWITPAVRPKSK